MSWKEVSAVQLRTAFVSLAQAPGANLRALCKQFSISPTTGYKWLRRFESLGEKGLEERSRRPRSSPNQSTVEAERLILALNIEHPGWGARKLKSFLEARNHAMPAVSTVHAILKRNERIDPAAALIKPFIRFEHERPNDLWQMDFKGHVPMRVGRCHPLTVLDDHSRFSLAIAACGDERGRTVQGHLIELFRRSGLPRRMMMDNGAPWGDEPDAYTWLEVWLMRQGIQVGHSRPYHPQTQGKLERLHGSLKMELFDRLCLIDLVTAQQTLDIWREMYNNERPHESIGLMVPASRYTPSLRRYQEHQPEIEYDQGADVRKVQGKGEIYWEGCVLRLGRAFIGERVGIMEGREDGKYDVLWAGHRIAQIDRQAKTVISGKSLR